MKEKIKLSGVPETMLQTVYARAKESRGRGTIHDAKEEEIIEKLDYDFSIGDNQQTPYAGYNQVMDFGENFSVEGFSEGDDVVITYTGTLGNEEKPPVITAMEAAQ